MKGVMQNLVKENTSMFCGDKVFFMQYLVFFLSKLKMLKTVFFLKKLNKYQSDFYLFIFITD